MLARVLKMGAEKTFEIISFNPHDPICIFFRPKSHLRVHRLKFKNSAKKCRNPKKDLVFSVCSLIGQIFISLDLIGSQRQLAVINLKTSSRETAKKFRPKYRICSSVVVSICFSYTWTGEARWMFSLILTFQYLKFYQKNFYRKFLNIYGEQILSHRECSNLFYSKLV